MESLALARYEAPGSQFVVAAGSSRQRSWSESNLASSLKRHLAGACGQECRVMFV